VLLTQGFKVGRFANCCQWKRMHSLPSSISERKAKSKIFSHNFSFLSDNFSLWTKTEEKQYQTLSENGGYIGRKIYVAERTYFLCLTATVHRKSYLKEAKSYLINVTYQAASNHLCQARRFKHAQVMPNRSRSSSKPVRNLLGSRRLVLNDPQDARPHRVADRFELLHCVNDKPRRQLRHRHRHIIRQHRYSLKIVFTLHGVHPLPTTRNCNMCSIFSAC